MLSHGAISGFTFRIRVDDTRYCVCVMWPRTCDLAVLLQKEEWLNSHVTDAVSFVIWALSPSDAVLILNDELFNHSLLEFYEDDFRASDILNKSGEVLRGNRQAMIYVICHVDGNHWR